MPNFSQCNTLKINLAENKEMTQNLTATDKWPKVKMNIVPLPMHTLLINYKRLYTSFYSTFYISYCTQLEMRDYELTEKERIKVKRLLLDIEAKSQQAEIYVEAAEKALESLTSEVDSYEKKQGVSGWDVFVPAVVGTAVGAAAGK